MKTAGTAASAAPIPRAAANGGVLGLQRFGIVRESIATAAFSPLVAESDFASPSQHSHITHTHTTHPHQYSAQICCLESCFSGEEVVGIVPRPSYVLSSLPPAAGRRRPFSYSSASTTTPTPKAATTDAWTTKDKAGLFLFGGLVVGTGTLGVWQAQRYYWKIDAIQERSEKLAKQPEPLTE